MRRLLAITLLAGCGDDAAMPAGQPDASVAEEPHVAAPTPPTLTPCAPGWLEIDGDPPRCEPWPDGRVQCTGATAQFPGERGCVTVGAECPDGDFAIDAPADAIFVRAGARGSGTRAAPFGTIAEATTSARRGAVIALASGTYEEAVDLPLDTTLLGACAAETTIVATTRSNSREGVVSVGRGTIRNVTLRGAREGIVVHTSARIEGVVIDGALASGLSVFPGASASGERIVVRDTQVADGVFGYGIAVAPDASVELERVVIERSTSSAIAASGTASLHDVAIEGTRPEPSTGEHGLAIEILGGGSVTLRRAALEDSRDRAISVSDPGSTLTLEDAVVRETGEGPEHGGNAALVSDGGALIARRVWLVGNGEVAVLLGGAGTSLELEDAIVEDTRAGSEGTAGAGLALQSDATAQIARTTFTRNQGMGIVVARRSELRVSDLAIRDTLGDAEGSFGGGISVQSGGVLEGERVAIERCRQSGLIALLPGSYVALSDLSVGDTLPRDCAMSSCAGLEFGDGVIAGDEGYVWLDRFVVLRSARAGLHAARGEIDAQNGWVVENPIGAVVQTADYDVKRLSAGVLFLDNDRNLDMTNLPLPMPSPGF